jgi:hypothetical protein
MNIQKALAEFITFSVQRDDAISVIVSTPAYDQAPLYTLKTDVLVDVIERCLSGEIDLDDLELWANVIESREDVDCAEHEGVIYALSNSEQMGEFNKQNLALILGLMII